MKLKYNVCLNESKWNICLNIFYKNLFYDIKRNKNYIFSLILPPPNITGSLHIGHAFQCALLDFLARSMLKNNFIVSWCAGVDHAGIATQVLIERSLLNIGLYRNIFTRKSFVKMIWYWKFYSFKIIISQLKILSNSINFSHLCFTLDSKYSLSVKTAFIQLYNCGFIYKKESLVNWDNVLKTTVSDLEVVSIEEICKLWLLKYYLFFNNCNLYNFICIATTKPETIFGDSAVLVNPDDIRYNKFDGFYVFVPLQKRIIPIILDKNAKLYFITGCVKVTPAHDFDDFLISLKYFLKKLNLYVFFLRLTKYNFNINNICLFILNYLYFYKLIKSVIFYKGTVKRSDRSQAIIEPILLNQWFVSVNKLGQESINVVINGFVKFYPNFYKNIFYIWMRNITDWCISRQNWWGHYIPSYFDKDNNIYVGFSKNSIRHIYVISDITILNDDFDVLDTWFSSAIWPFAIYKWPELTNEYLLFYPISVLITGYDILFFWVSRMMMFGLFLTKNIPFKKIFIHGLIRDECGRKMSKSKGNIIDPLELSIGKSFSILLRLKTLLNDTLFFKKEVYFFLKRTYFQDNRFYGSDILRLIFCSSNFNNKSIFFDKKYFEFFRNFFTKLWSLANFFYLYFKQYGFFFNFNIFFVYKKKKFFLTKFFFNTYILKKWFEIKFSIKYNLMSFKFNSIILDIYKFVMNIFSSFYIELFKKFCIWYKRTSNYLYNLFIFSFCLFIDLLKDLYPILPNLVKEILYIFNRFFLSISFFKLSFLKYNIFYLQNIMNLPLLNLFDFLFILKKELKFFLSKNIKNNNLIFLYINKKTILKQLENNIYFNKKYICAFVGINDICIMNFSQVYRNLEKYIHLFFFQNLQCFLFFSLKNSFNVFKLQSNETILYSKKKFLLFVYNTIMKYCFLKFSLEYKIYFLYNCKLFL